MADAFGHQLTFPMLTVGGLIEGFRQDLGTEFDIREDDFTHPSKEKWVRLYCFLLAHITDNDVDDRMTHLRSVGHEFLDHPELYVESHLLMNLAKFMAQVLIQCKIVDFTMDDIVFPTKKRLVHVLSGIMNYIRFRANRKEEFANIIQNMAAQVEQRELLRKENEELARKIEEIRKRRAEESEAVTKVLGQVEVCGSRFDQLSKNSTLLKKASEDMKLQITKKRLDMQKRQEKVTRVAAEIQKIEEQIVTSPDRFEVEIREFENKQDCMNRIQQERQKTAKLRKLQKLRNSQDLAEHRQNVKEVAVDWQTNITMEKLTSELNCVLGRVQDLQEAAAALQKFIQMQNLGNLSKQERMEKVEIVSRQEEEQFELELQKVTIKDDMKKEFADELEIIDSERQSIRLEAAEKLKAHEENMKMLQNEYASLLSAFEAYNQNYVGAQENVIPDLLKGIKPSDFSPYLWKHTMP